MDPLSEAPASFEFGRFRILPQRREVLDDGQPMQLGGRAFDVLTVLLKAKGGARQQRRTEEPGLAGPDRISAAMKAERSEASSNQVQRRIKFGPITTTRSACRRRTR